MEVVRELRMLGVIFAVGTLVAAPTAVAVGATKLLRGGIQVTVITKSGKPDLTSTGYEICASKKAKVSGSALKPCVTVRRGRAALTNLPTGVWYLHPVGGAGQGPCYNKKNDGSYSAPCSPVTVRSGRTTRINWYVPPFG
jgi:hypothetical protein